MMSLNDLKAIVSFGGGVTVDASLGTTALKELVSFTNKQGRVVVKNAGRLHPDDLKAIASFGPGHVHFEDL